jgi:hypothetical protein
MHICATSLTRTSPQRISVLGPVLFWLHWRWLRSRLSTAPPWRRGISARRFCSMCWTWPEVGGFQGELVGRWRDLVQSNKFQHGRQNVLCWRLTEWARTNPLSAPTLASLSPTERRSPPKGFCWRNSRTATSLAPRPCLRKQHTTLMVDRIWTQLPHLERCGSCVRMMATPDVGESRLDRHQAPGGPHVNETRSGH